jgi:uncharacterized protein (DUF885 family)
MKRIFLIFLLVVYLGTGGGNLLCQSLKKSRSEASEGSKLLKEVETQFWQFLLQESNYSLYLRQKLGLEIKTLPDFSFKKSQNNVAKFKVWLQRLKAVEPEDITYDESLTWEILIWELENQIKAHNFFWLNIPIAAYSSPIPNINRVFIEFEFKQEKDLEQYLDLLDRYPTIIDEIMARLKQQQQKKIILAKAALIMPVYYLSSIIQPAEKSIFYINENRLKSFSHNPPTIKNFQRKVAEVVTNSFNPKLKKLLSFIQGEYAKESPDRVGLWQYPGGKDYYEFLVKYNTSLDLNPEEIHKIGLREIKNLLEKMDKIRQQLKFEGDLNAFFHFLKTDPRFKPKSADEIGKRMNRFKDQVKTMLPDYFSRIPKAPCTAKRLDPLLESSMTYGYYQTPTATDPTGYYLYNASNLENKNILNTASASLILHELLPGHHFQFAVQSENKTLTPFRQEYFLIPNAEGWAEYACQLGIEMGIYKDPYDLCGLIFQDLFMSVRLVVDTGMNSLQWPREKAKKFMKKYLLTSDFEIETETLRYSTGIPAQALAYKMGSLKMWELRKKAEKKLGAKFDLRRFHDALLGKGSLPLFLLEKHVDHFIWQENIVSSR